MWNVTMLTNYWDKDITTTLRYKTLQEVMEDLEHKMDTDLEATSFVFTIVPPINI